MGLASRQRCGAGLGGCGLRWAVGGAVGEPGGCGFLWEGPGAAVPASEEGSPGSRPGGVGAPRTVHRAPGLLRGGLGGSQGCGGRQQVLPEGEWSLGDRDGEG